MHSRLPLLAALVLAVGVAGCSPSAGSNSNLGIAQVSLAQGNYEAALASVEEALTTNPDDVDALNLKAEILFQQAEATEDLAARVPIIEEMVATVQRAQAVAPTEESVGVARDRAWYVAVNSGNDALRANDDATAATLFQSGIDVQPDSSQAYFGLGLARFRSNDAAAAVAPFERASTIAPDDPTLAVYYGRALLRADRASEGITALEDAASRFPDDEDVQTEILNAYAAAGRTDEAIQRYEAAIANRPNDPVYRYNYGALLLQADRFDEAIEQLERSTELDPTNPDALYNLGAAYQNRAAALNTQANEAADNAEANRLLQQRDENIQQAIPYFEQARELVAGEPGEADVCLALFQLYSQVNRMDEAEAAAECAGISMN